MMGPQITAQGYYLPKNALLKAPVTSVSRQNEAGSVSISQLELGREDLGALVGTLRDNQEWLKGISDNELERFMGSNLEQWIDPDYKGRKISREVLPITLGYSPEMVDTILTSTFQTLREDLGDVLKGESKGLVVTQFSDIPGAQIVTLIESLCHRSACLCRSPFSEPVFTKLYLDSIRDADPTLGECVAAISWDNGKPGARDMDRALYGNLLRDDMIVLYGSKGSAELIESVKNPDTNLKAFTRGLGMIILGKEMLASRLIDETVNSCSMAASLYNRGSCFSPQLIFVEENGEISPEAFSRILAEDMSRVAKNSLPIGYVPSDSYARFAQAHQSSILQQIMGSISYFPVADYRIPVGGVVYQKEGHSDIPRSGLRMVSVVPFKEIDRIPEVLGRYDGQLHSVGLGVGNERYSTLKEAIYANTKSRVAPLERFMLLSFEDYPLYEDGMNFQKH